jgi:small subunit ribosomal protein S20
MPIIKSAKKRVKVAEKQSTQNSKTKRSLKESVKAFHASLKNKKDTTKTQSDAYSAIDTAVKKGVISKNKAARKKSQLNAAAKAAGSTKPGTKKATTKKTSPAPKSATKKAAVKKTPAKKATTKK